MIPTLAYIEAASRRHRPCASAGQLVILESTSPVGATEAMADWLAEARPDLTSPRPMASHGHPRGPLAPNESCPAR